VEEAAVVVVVVPVCWPRLAIEEVDLRGKSPPVEVIGMTPLLLPPLPSIVEAAPFDPFELEASPKCALVCDEVKPPLILLLLPPPVEEEEVLSPSAFRPSSRSSGIEAGRE
jgi:hypothetical protein